MRRKCNKLAGKVLAGVMGAALMAGLFRPMEVQAADNRLEIPKFETAPVIDGTVSEEEWGKAAFTVKDGEENIQTLDEGGVFPADFTADIYLGYDSTHIYIAAVAEYEIHKNEALLPTDLWAGDCMQIQISDSIGTDRNELGFTFNSLTQKQQAVAWASTGDFTMEGGEGQDYIVYRDGTKTVYEIALGIEQFTKKITEFTDGMTMPFSLSFHMSGGGFLEYCAGIVQAKDINLAALIGLGAAPDENAAPVVGSDSVNVNENLLDSRNATGNRDVPGIIEAEDYDELYGTEIHINEECPDGTGNLGWTSDGDYMVYKNVNFTSVPTGVDLRTSGVGEPVVQIRLDAVDGTKIAEVKVTPSGDWDTYTTSSAQLTDTDGLVGTHDVYVLINGGMNLNYIEFTGDTTESEEASTESTVEEPSEPESAEESSGEEQEESSEPAAAEPESAGSNTTVIVVVVIVAAVVIAGVAVVVLGKKKGDKASE